ncbi:MAG: snoRNA-binding rRNA-processing protein utp10 [Sclerophora amabilis]|nr:MAG: snoRNA-binding rRNA-processing protein utp10 [Sclerophora amabilis]
MASTLATQLSQIAAHSTNSLNLKAQKAAHAQSLIFDPPVAATQDFETLYAICIEGFQELCLLDHRFAQFGRSIFSEQSKGEERTQMTQQENKELDGVLEDFLGLVSGRLLLRPAVKAVEWLVRRFRVHEYNTSFLILTFLPYHTDPLFLTLLSILPSAIPEQFRFLHPYVKSLANPPRHTIVYSATNSQSFMSLLNAHVLRICRAHQHYHGLLALWGGILTEAASGMLDMARSGRKGIQQQNEEDVAIRLLPVLNDGLAMKKVPELRLGCYMLLTVLSAKAHLGDTVLDGMMQAVVSGCTKDTFNAGLLCLGILAQKKEKAQLPKVVVKEVLKAGDVETRLINISKSHRIAKLTLGLALGIIDANCGGPDATPRLTFLEKVLEARIMTDAQASLVMSSMLRAAQNIDHESNETAESRLLVADFLLRLLGSTNAGHILQRALEDTSIDVDSLEMKLQTVIRPAEGNVRTSGHNVEMLDTNPSPAPAETFESVVQRVPSRTVDEVSFLSPKKSHIFDSLAYAFLLAIPDSAHLESFSKLPILRWQSATEDPWYFSFFVRVWCGPYPTLARTMALNIVKTSISSEVDKSKDFQALLPYLINALTDHAKKVRRGAADVVIALHRIYNRKRSKEQFPNDVRIWGREEIYGHIRNTKEINSISWEAASKFIEDVLMQGIEECVLDSNYIGRLIEDCLRGSSRSKANDASTITSSLRSSEKSTLLSFLSSHVFATPLFAVKLNLLSIFNRVTKIGGVSRTRTLLPMLEAWVLLGAEEIMKQCEIEKVKLEDLEDQIVKVVTANDSGGLDLLQEIVKGERATNQPSLTRASLGRLRQLWSSLKGESKNSIGLLLLRVSMNSIPNRNVPESSQALAMDILRSAHLSTNVLKTLLDDRLAALDVQDETPASKRRRTSHNRSVALNADESSKATVALGRLTFVLEMIDSSNPATHLQLLEGLLQALAKLQHFKSRIGSELAFVQTLVLGSILEIVNSFKDSHDKRLDPSIIRTDLLIDCVRSTASPEVQNAALLVVSSLATVVPELVLHSVMPIFTFMGATVLRQDDEYSVHVVNQTILKVIPPLVASLKVQNRDIVSGTAGLLLSFVSAFEHIPPHRRLRLFTSLVRTLGERDFLFATLAMFVDKYMNSQAVEAFAVDFAAQFDPETQILTAGKYLNLVMDIWKPERTLSDVILSPGDIAGHRPTQLTSRLFTLLERIISQSSLGSQVKNLMKSGDQKGDGLRDAFTIVFENLIVLLDVLKNDTNLRAACDRLLETSLDLLSTVELLKSISALLMQPDDELRRKSLIALERRLRKSNANDEASRKGCLAFVSKLTDIAQETAANTPLKITAISCLDQILEKYGKKDTEITLAAATIISTPNVLDYEDDNIRIMTLLCLSSIVGVLGPGIIPILPQALPVVLQHLTLALDGDSRSPKLHNAAYSFFGALILHVPWMISGAQLENLLVLSYQSAEADVGAEADSNRIQTLQAMAQRVEPKEALTAFEKTWTTAVTVGPLAVKEYLRYLTTLVEKHPKSVIMRQSQILGENLLKAFGLRQTQASGHQRKYEAEEIDSIEQQTNDLALKMIMKMNDTVFRPVFLSIVGWACNRSKKSRTGNVARLITFFGFLDTFFDTLQSLVTGYASYILTPAIEVLNTASPQDPDTRLLWTATLRALEKSFQHDQDDFWQSPSHFSAILPPLLACISHASALPPSSLPITQTLIPAITALTSATDSHTQQKDLNTSLMSYLRSSEARVRLAAVRCEVALAKQLGEEWLTLLPEMLPFISELREDGDEEVERETERWIKVVEGKLGEGLDEMLQ